MIVLFWHFREIESSAALIEGFTAASTKKGGKGGVDPIQKSLINVRGQLQKAEEKNAELEENVKDAEDAAREKSEELSNVIRQLRAYEKGKIIFAEVTIFFCNLQFYVIYRWKTFF